MQNFTFLFCLFCLAISTTNAQRYAKAADIWHTVEGNSTLVVMYDLQDFEEGEFVYISMLYEYYDRETSRIMSITPSQEAMRGANDETYRQITKAESRQRIIKNCVITWDLELEAFRSLPAGDIILDVWTVAKNKDKEFWKMLKSKQRLSERWLLANQKGRHRKAKRLAAKIENLSSKKKRDKREGCPVW